jgi:ferric-dicitrate binding protein FerR (iron transport regulator)
MAWRQLTAADGSTVYVNTAMAASVAPNGSGSRVTLALQSEGHAVTITVQQAPSVVLNADNPT